MNLIKIRVRMKINEPTRKFKIPDEKKRTQMKIYHTIREWRAGSMKWCIHTGNLQHMAQLYIYIILKMSTQSTSLKLMFANKQEKRITNKKCHIYKHYGPRKLNKPVTLFYFYPFLLISMFVCIILWSWHSNIRLWVPILESIHHFSSLTWDLGCMWAVCTVQCTLGRRIDFKPDGVWHTLLIM